MDDCLFCRILRHEHPATFVYEDDLAAAILDLYPVHRGHTLVLPKRHATDLLDCSVDVAGHLFAVSARLAPAIVRAVDAQGFNIWTANGGAAGQTVFHLHLHVLPRFVDDTFGLRFPRNYPSEARREELDKIAARIRSTA